MTITANASYKVGPSLVRKLEAARKRFNDRCEEHIARAAAETELLDAGFLPSSVWSADASWWYSYNEDTAAAADKMRELIPIVGEFDEPSKSLCGPYTKAALPDTHDEWVQLCRRPKDSRFDFVVVCFNLPLTDDCPCKIVESTEKRRSLVCEA